MNDQEKTALRTTLLEDCLYDNDPLIHHPSCVDFTTIFVCFNEKKTILVLQGSLRAVIRLKGSGNLPSNKKPHCTFIHPKNSFVII